jgi:hypothetical protein
MDKVKQNIDLQNAIQAYNIEKSVVGTLAYNIDQNIQKGMSPDEAIEDVLQKSKSMPIGTIHNGFKKIADGKWRKVSEHGMTKEEHEKKVSEHRKRYETKNKNGEDDESTGKEIQLMKIHSRIAKEELDSKDYSDEEVTGGEKKDAKFEEQAKRIVGETWNKLDSKTQQSLVNKIKEKGSKTLDKYLDDTDKTKESKKKKFNS